MSGGRTVSSSKWGRSPRWAALGLFLSAAGGAGCSLKARPLPHPPQAEPAPTTQETAVEPAVMDWSYTGANGPNSWGKLRDEWAACGQAGQSPIDLPLSDLDPSTDKNQNPSSRTHSALSSSKLEVKLGSLPLQVQSDGRLVTVHGTSTQILSIDGQPASLDRIELHQPAEHKLSGVAMDFEMVLWFARPNASPVLLSLLFRQGAENTALNALLMRLPQERSYGKTVLGTQLQLSELINQPEAKVLSYSGSLSAPPCTAEIPRLVYMYVGELSAEQLQQLRKVVPHSQRPVQALGERNVVAVVLSNGATASSPSDAPN